MNRRRALASASVLALLLAVPNECFALWGLMPVTVERAKELGIEVRSTAVGPNHVRVEVELQIAGNMKDFGRVDLRFGAGDNPPLTAALKEDRSKPGCAAVGFTADRADLPKIDLWVMVPAPLGGTAYTIRVKDFVDANERPKAEFVPPLPAGERGRG